MNILSILHFIAFLLYNFLGITIVFNNPKSLINRVCAALIACWAIWSLGSIMIHTPFTSKASAMQFENLISVGWIGFFGFFLWFSWLFTERKKFVSTWVSFFLLFVIPFILITKQWTGFLVSDLSRQSYGWAIVWSSSVWPFIYFGYMLVFFFWSIGLILDYWRKTENDNKKKQSRIIVISAAIVLPIGFLTNVVLPKLDLRILPDVADILGIFWAIGLVYAMVRYRFLAITPAMAADNILSTMSDSLIILDPKGKILQVNQATRDLLGYHDDEIKTRLFSDIFKSGDEEKKIVAAILEGQNISNIELLFTTFKGKEIPVIFSSSSLKDEKGSPRAIICICRDIRDWKKIEEELRISENRFKTLFEYAPDAYFLYDLKGTFIDGNRVAINMVGYEKEELIGRNFFTIDLLSAQGKKRAARLIPRNVMGDPAGPAEFILNRKDGKKMIAEIRSIPVKIKNKTMILGVARDITLKKKAENELNLYRKKLEKLVEERTAKLQASNVLLQKEIVERKLAEETLQKSKEKFQTLTENINVGIYRSTIGPKSRFIEVNPAMVDIFRFDSREEMLNTDINTLYLDPEDRKRYIRKIEKEGFTKNEELRLVRKNKIPFIGSVSAVLIKEKNGKIQFLDGIVEDITVRKRLEEQLIQSQKMEAIGRLSGGIAHDFNNLLTSIIGYTEISRMKVEKESPLVEYFKQILKAADHAKDLIQQLLAFSRKAMIQPKVIVLNQVIKNFSKILLRVLGEDIQLSFKPKKNLGNVKVDPSQIEQIIMNLAVNSRDAMPKGGKLIISTDNITLNKEMTKQYPYMLPGHYVSISVSDTGHGITKEALSHIYEPFFTTKKKTKGTGLGLSTVYGIIKQNSGYINVYSEVNQGTTVKIYFPRVDEPAEDLEIDRKITELPTGKETILLVEDEEAVRDVAVKVLSECGYQVFMAQNGDKAVSLWKKEEVRIDLLLTDIVLPTMSGFDLSRRLRTLKPSLKVLYMSGYSEEIITHRGIMEKDLFFIQKPFTSLALAKKIREVLDA